MKPIKITIEAETLEALYMKNPALVANTQTVTDYVNARMRLMLRSDRDAARFIDECLPVTFHD